MLPWLLAATLAMVASTSAVQAQVAIEDIRMQLFHERTGTFSENIVGSRKTFMNTPKGEGDAAEPAEQVLVTLVFSGPRNSRSSDRIARDLANVSVSQDARTGRRTLLQRAYGGFLFGENGRYHKAFMLDSATCAPLEVDVRVGRSRRTAKVDFRCAE